jgi:hypothetical protein
MGRKGTGNQKKGNPCDDGEAADPPGGPVAEVLALRPVPGWVSGEALVNPMPAVRGAE